MRRAVPFALAAALLVALAVGWLPVLRFRAEEIHVTLHPCGYDVEGRYWYRNPLPIPWVQGLVVPTATGDGIAAPATVEVEVDGVGTSARWLLGAPRVQIRVPARAEVEVKVRFHQEATAGRGVYLLTTTRSWGRPIEEARFFLHTEGVRALTSDLPAGMSPSEEERQDSAGYEIRDLFPDTDWTFSWEPSCAG